MHAFTAHCEGNIHAVVDEEGDVVGFAFLVELLCCGDEGSSFGCLVAVLDDCDSCLSQSMSCRGDEMEARCIWW